MQITFPSNYSPDEIERLFYINNQKDYQIASEYWNHKVSCLEFEVRRLQAEIYRLELQTEELEEELNYFYDLENQI